MDQPFQFKFAIQPAARAERLQQSPMLIWFTGLPGSGKSTLANALEQRLFQAGFHSYILDGDHLRGGINRGLDFSKEGRSENLRRAAEIARLMLDAGLVVIAAFVSPYAADRNEVQAIVGASRYLEIFVDTPLDICEQRDPKGLYRRARSGEIPDLTGIHQPYERPTNPFARVDSSVKSAEEIIDLIFGSIASRLAWQKT